MARPVILVIISLKMLYHIGCGVIQKMTQLQCLAGYILTMLGRVQMNKKKLIVAVVILACFASVVLRQNLYIERHIIANESVAANVANLKAQIKVSGEWRVKNSSWFSDTYIRDNPYQIFITFIAAPSLEKLRITEVKIVGAKDTIIKQDQSKAFVQKGNIKVATFLVERVAHA